MKILPVKITLFLLITLWCAGFFFMFIPYLPQKAPFFWLPLKFAYSRVCHQQPYKLITLGSNHTLVCARCAGIYVGALLAGLFSLVLPKLKPFKFTLFLLFSIPMLLDVILYNLNVYDYSKNIAFISGLFFGCAGFFVILESSSMLYSEIFEKD